MEALAVMMLSFQVEFTVYSVHSKESRGGARGEGDSSFCGPFKVKENKRVLGQKSNYTNKSKFAFAFNKLLISDESLAGGCMGMFESTGSKV